MKLLEVTVLSLAVLLTCASVVSAETNAGAFSDLVDGTGEAFEEACADATQEDDCRWEFPIGCDRSQGLCQFMDKLLRDLGLGE